MRVYRREQGGVYYAAVYEHRADGTRVRVRRSTGCHDRAAAEAVARRWERDGADPTIARTRGVTLEQVLTLLVEQREERARAGAGSEDTAQFYAAKSGPLLREIGGDTLVASLDAAVVDRYVSTRRAQWADDARTRRVSDHTITKELTALRAALKLALRRGLWQGAVDAVIPRATELSPRYEPRTRHLTPTQAQHLLAALTTSNAVAVASFVLATGAEWRAVELARRGDIDLPAGRVLLRGTKTATRTRVVPVVTDWQRSLLVRVLEHAEGEAPALFAPWGNVRRDLHAACRASGCAAVACPKLRVSGRGACRDEAHRSSAIPRVSPHDLRRTFATWLRASGLATDVLGAVLGHRDGRMAERVYARLSPSDLASRMRRDLGATTETPVRQTQRTQGDLADTADVPDSGSSAENLRDSVPRDGIEPPTRGFSVPALGWRSPQRKRRKRVVSAGAETPVRQRQRRG